MQTPQEAKELTLLKRESKSFEAIQQGAVLSLLIMNGVEIEIACPSRFASKAMQLFVVNDVITNNTRLGFGNMVEAQCTAQFANDSQEMKSGTDKKKLLKNIKRRKELNRAALSFNSLLALAENFGYVFELKQVKSAKKTLQMSKVRSVRIGNSVILDESNLYSVGVAMNKYVASLCGKGTSVVGLKPYDPVVLSFLGQNNSTIEDYSSTGYYVNSYPQSVCGSQSPVYCVDNNNTTVCCEPYHLTLIL
ncbi:hypothetical protein EIN_175600 [Entamoeba invadens IP1]|uniref:hypothetical protein n=1 Tax=Entamoeba invadens IP1 TaxID=370355 RepID=UPI0002C3D15B|nr:hypothetical protein EIN_175600 [Entamoeba invadens IP1]ELP93773.1 hypothetical protein EIN_175600 [Entamoeba invadens IP1]|eukprot:XP_004260544.1 hypothetical protein EIN_175600 [Entamoeba invadens IP1]